MPNFINETPLIDAQPGQVYQGVPLGLYGNEYPIDPPPDRQAWIDIAEQNVLPINGTIGVLSIGASTARDIFTDWTASAQPNPLVKFVNGAQGGVDAKEWAESQDPWKVANQALKAANVSKDQIRVLWHSNGHYEPENGGGFPDHAQALRDDFVFVINKAKGYLPNLEIVYCSSRVFGGHSIGSPGSKENYAYENAFAVRATSNFYFQSGATMAVCWGPYFWGDGTNARSDGLTWEPADFDSGGVHLTPSGLAKTTGMLNSFFGSKEWFD